MKHHTGRPQGKIKKNSQKIKTSVNFFYVKKLIVKIFRKVVLPSGIISVVIVICARACQKFGKHDDEGNEPILV